MKKRISFALLLLVTTYGLLQAANQTYSFKFESNKRSYILHTPPGANGELPLVIHLHGGGGHAAQHQEYVQMDALADAEKFLVAYPNGSGFFAGRLLTWNAGTCCGWARDHEVNDVGFLTALIDEVAQHAPVNRKRVYVTGFSNGAMMAHRAAAETQGIFAAIAAVEGAPVIPNFNPKATAVMIIHSVTDPRALYEGGQGPAFPGTKVRSTHESVEKLVGNWVAADGCTAAPVVTERKGERHPAHSATKTTYGGCRDDSEVVFWKLKGPGHVWPGAGKPAFEKLVGEPTTIIDANQEIWSFFKEHSLP